MLTVVLTLARTRHPRRFPRIFLQQAILKGPKQVQFRTEEQVFELVRKPI